MTPGPLVPDIIAIRLRMITDVVKELRALGPLTGDRLNAEPVTRAAAERFIQSMTDLAIDVNAHVIAATRHQAPSSGRESFELAAEIGALTQELAANLARVVGLRNVLVHRYIDINVELVADSAEELVILFESFVKQQAAYSLQQGESRAD